jgi:predicted metal-dependent phosphoesterase TrpH
MISVRAAVHVHSSWSFDGTASLSRLATAFRRRRYRAVLLADHSQSLSEADWSTYRAACAELSTPELLLVPGMEYRDPDNVVHVATWGDLPHLGDRVPTGTLLREVADRGGVAIWAHPERRDAHQVFEESWAPYLSGVEVWNRKYDGWRPSAVGADAARQWGLPEIASLDFHKRRQHFPLAIYLDVSALTVDGVVDALRAGRVEACFARMPVSRWQHGLRRSTLSAADRSRRVAASALRGSGLI